MVSLAVILCLSSREIRGGGSGWRDGAKNARPLGPITFVFMQFWGKLWPNNRLVPLPLGLAPRFYWEILDLPLIRRSSFTYYSGNNERHFERYGYLLDEKVTVSVHKPLLITTP